MRVLTEDEWESVRHAGRFARFSDGDYLGHQGEDDQTVFIVQSGQVKIVLVGEDGSQYLVGLRRSGETVGEMAAIDARVRSASMIAKGSCAVYVLTQAQYLEYLAAYPEASLRAMRTMAQRLRQAAAAHVLRGGPLIARVAATLVGMAESAEADAEQEAGFDTLVLTQQELADWVGATREATGRAVSTLKSQGLITTSRGRIELVDRERLSEL